jgi:hypothetical protein
MMMNKEKTTPEFTTKVRIELTFDLQSSNLQMKSGSPTVVLYGVLRLAGTFAHKEIPESAAGGPRRVLIDYDVGVHTALINTLGERAEDTFLISGAVLSNERAVLRLQADLLAALSVR